jgi:hypothetical protein
VPWHGGLAQRTSHPIRNRRPGFESHQGIKFLWKMLMFVADLICIVCLSSGVLLCDGLLHCNDFYAFASLFFSLSLFPLLPPLSLSPLFSLPLSPARSLLRCDRGGGTVSCHESCAARAPSFVSRLIPSPAELRRRREEALLGRKEQEKKTVTSVLPFPKGWSTPTEQNKPSKQTKASNSKCGTCVNRGLIKK